MKPVRQCATVMGAVGILALALTASAAQLDPGNVVTPVPDEGPIDGVLLDTLVENFNSISLKGTLTSKVYRNDASSPYDGGLTFTYEIALDANSLHALSRLSVSSFEGWDVDVSYDAAAASPFVAPFAADRGTSGAVVGFFFPFGTGIPVGENSALLIVQTSSDEYQPTIASVINGQSASVNSFAPTMVPEPSTVALLLLGLAGFVVSRRTR